MSRSRSRFVILLLLAALFPGSWLIIDRWSRQEALAALDQQVDRIARQHLQLIESELARFRLLTVVLGEYGDLTQALSGAPGAAGAFSDRLAFLAQETGAPVLYAIDPRGIAIAASNARTAQSYVGQDFGFRPYFSEAMRDGAATYYGSGLVTGRPGLFLARRVEAAGTAFGVIVVKYEFDALLRQWQGDPGVSLILGEQGIVLSATDPAARLSLLAPLSPESAAATRAEGRFPEHVPQPGPYRRAGDGGFSAAGRPLVAASRPIGETGLTLVHLMPREAALRAAARRSWLLAFPAWGLLLALAAGLWWRMTRAAKAAADRRALEQAVESRTAELRREMAERARADRAGQQAREALEQANRLASLGQITAGLAHEVNQPVATIRTLAENARHHLAAGRSDRVDDALERSVALTTRIGAITGEMRRFARPGSIAIAPVALDAALDGLQLILGDRLRRAGCTLERPVPGLRVMADLTRLEQVLVNLVQNALDAMEGQPAPRIALIAGQDFDSVTLLVADNGPGLPPALADTLFHPFVSASPEGLGLGLGIARDIMRSLGGELETAASPLGGAAFLIRMRPA